MEQKYPQIFDDWTREDVMRFIESGGNVNYEGSGLLTPLIYACKRKDRELVKYLLEKGANPDSDLSALIYSTEETFDLLIEYGANIHYLREANQKNLIYYTQPYATEALLKMGLDVNFKANGANILFHYSKPFMNEEKIKILFENGVDSQMIFEECNALEHAIYNGYHEYVAILLKCGMTADKEKLINDIDQISEPYTLEIVLEKIIFQKLDEHSLDTINRLIASYPDDYSERQINNLLNWKKQIESFHEKYVLHEYVSDSFSHSTKVRL